ncbi:MAG: STAS domain-containing protein [Planctomycetes bacterium]|nr:STAS domain-containing protein [Planctomycetota bacterium]
MKANIKFGDRYNDISGSSADEFASELLYLEDGDFEEVVLDFEGTEHINSMALGSIFAAHQKLQQQGRKMSLINVNDQIKRLMEVANLADILSSEDERVE